MISFILLMFIPVILSILSLIVFKKDECWQGVIIQISIVAIIIGAGLGISYYQGTSDHEIWNGQVTGKQRIQVSCEHSYQCNCIEIPSTDSKGNTTYTRICQTCYEHPYDVDWRVSASTGETINIGRVDRQGLTMPSRWGVVYEGEPFSSGHRFENYIKANPKSVLLGQKGDLKRFGSLIPVYPSVYDYYKVNHILNEGVPLAQSELDQYNWLLAQADKTLGTSKQVNLILVLVKTDDPAYVYAFRDAWLGGKKNDAIILIGSMDGNKIDWADVVSWTPNKQYAINVRDRIMEQGYLNHRDAIVNIIAEETQNQFVRMHMKNMKYLVRNFQPSGTVMIWLFIIGLFASIGAAGVEIYVHRQNQYNY